ncbi:extensin-like domain-containing protein [Aureimonas psammosilenae]|uniref:extensin-like domain-containing protein n=1 Tax=Aureimonas psammosilenae TaxID=2495496 RepID=UPI00186A215E|nr:extensin family protein [Aureimonas psammosilenae]
MKVLRAVVASGALACTVLAPIPSWAASDLPWSDANPLEGSSQQKAKPKPERKADPAKQAVQAETTGTPAPEAPVPKPSPEPTPVKAASPIPEPSTVPVPEPDPRPEAKEAPPEAAPTPAPSPPAPPAAETKPVDEIPVPEKRPDEGKPVPPEAKPVEGQGGVEPAKPEDAPNSTEKLKSREPVIDPATSVVAAAAIEDAEECEAELKKRGVEFTVGESISEGECGVLRPVAVSRLSSGVKVGPDTKLLCRAALALDVWMSDAVAPAAKKEFPDRKLTEFRQASTYVCRPRASETGISEHSRGSAVDIGSFVFDKGSEIGIAAQAPDTPEERFLAAVRQGACGPFKTVLGPGTDADHATHFHLDIAARKNGSTYCK